MVSSELSELATKVEALSGDMAELRRRVSQLESREPDAPILVRAPVEEDLVVVAQGSVERVASRIVSLAGRTLVVLGGAFLLRAISESPSVPDRLGVVAGFSYGIWWFVACHRTAGKDRFDATFHGLAASIVSFPLVYEATVRFAVLGTWWGAAAVVGLLAGGMYVAMRRELPSLAWTVNLFAMATALALLLATRDVIPVACALLLAAAGLETFAIDEPWRALRWPMAAAADLVVLLLTALLARPAGLPESYTPISLSSALVLQLALPILYLVSIPARTLLFQRRVTAVGMAQCVVALLIGLGGAARVLTVAGRPTLTLGVVTVTLGIGCYAVAFAWLDRRTGRDRNFYFYATLALILVLTGSHTLLSGQTLALTWLSLALGVAWLGRKLDRTTLAAQALAYWLAAVLVAGLLSAATQGLLRGASERWDTPTPAALLASVVGLFCYVLLLAGSRGQDDWLSAAQRVTFLTLGVWGAAGALAGGLGQLFADAGNPSADAGLLSTIRTGVLALGAVALAATRRRWRTREVGWLVYPVLAAAGVKLLVDLGSGRPVTLFMSLALYGSALFAIPKLSAPAAAERAPTEAGRPGRGLNHGGGG